MQRQLVGEVITRFEKKGYKLVAMKVRESPHRRFSVLPRLDDHRPNLPIRSQADRCGGTDIGSLRYDSRVLSFMAMARQTLKLGRSFRPPSA